MSWFRANESRPAPPALARPEALRLKDLARLREGAYRLFGSLLLFPDAEWIATLPRVAEGLLAESRPFQEFAFWGRWEALLGALQRLGDADRPALEAAYVGDLTVPSGETPCPLYESTYLPRKDVPWVMAALDREYAGNGFSLAPAAKEPPDHAAVELEFMSLLCGREVEAWERKAVAEAAACLGRERGFLDRHLCRWFPEFIRRAANRNDGGFYPLVADAVQGFIAHDLDLVTALYGRFLEVAEA